MNILYLNPSGNLGGAERSLLTLMAAVHSVRPSWVMNLVSSGEGSFVTEAKALGIATTVLPFPPSLAALGDWSAGGSAGNGNRHATLTLMQLCAAIPGVAAYIAKLRSVINATAPDIVHTNGFKMHILGRWSCPRGVPIIWHVRDYVGPRPLMSRLLRAHSSRAAAAIANSHSVAEDLRVSCNGRLRIFTIHNAVNLDRFSPTGPQLDLEALAGLPRAKEGAIRVGLIATMARWKGHEVFLRALSLLPRDLPILGYIISGPLYQTNGSQYSIEELRRSAALLGLSSRVGFTGFLQDPAAAMRALDIVVHASTQPEPFGLVIAEAMACRKAVIASAAGGATEIISPGIDALAHPPGDAVALARSIQQLAVGARMRTRLGKAGRATVERRFGLDRLTEALIPIYQSLAGSTS
ncbi:MAG: glycosyltransferase family 4 protein, partial [Acidobacteriota bacterium]